MPSMHTGTYIWTGNTTRSMPECPSTTWLWFEQGKSIFKNIFSIQRVCIYKYIYFQASWWRPYFELLLWLTFTYERVVSLALIPHIYKNKPWSMSIKIRRCGSIANETTLTHYQDSITKRQQSEKKASKWQMLNNVNEKTDGLYK